MTSLEVPVRPEALAARDWLQVLAAYREPDTARSIFEIVTTVVPLVVLWVAAWQALSVGYWLTLLITIPAAGLLVRLFLIQHDCGHGAFFRHRWVNDWVGRVAGVFTMTPYDVWRRSHAIHHATSGNLDHRGIGDIYTLTVREYTARPFLQRLGYRLYRHPLVMFGLGPAFLFLLQHRFPAGQMRAGWLPWMSAMGTNAGIAVFSAIMMWLIGVGPFLMVHIPIVVLAASMGVWLFYVQHQFEDTYWAEDDTWKHADAALHGSSYYDLPIGLRWLTGNIGVHHVHHLYSRIPFYKLGHVMRDHPALASIRRITLWRSFSLVRLTLWDEDQRRLVPFSAVGAVR